VAADGRNMARARAGITERGGRREERGVGAGAGGRNGSRAQAGGTGHGHRLGEEGRPLVREGGSAAGGGSDAWIGRLGMMLWVGWEFLWWYWVGSGSS
jgi:hypothetical protein